MQTLFACTQAPQAQVGIQCWAGSRRAPGLGQVVHGAACSCSQSQRCGLAGHHRTGLPSKARAGGDHKEGSLTTATVATLVRGNRQGGTSCVHLTQATCASSIGALCG